MMTTRLTAPNLIVAQRVLEKMRAAARTHLEDETGEAMVGLVVNSPQPGGVPSLYVLDTISPDESAVRQFHTFQQGDDRQDEIVWWLQENWRVGRERKGLAGFLQKNKWDVPLRYLGDWHKQPGNMIQPSGGDLMTALRWIGDEENGMTFLLAPILTLGHPSTVQPSAASGANFVMIPDGEPGEAMRADFWYIDARTAAFQPITPVVYPNDQLPTLAPYPWHLVKEQRFEDELALLNKEKLFHSVTLYNADGETPLEVCFLTARMGGDRMYIVVTPHDYPIKPPSLRTAPFIPLENAGDMYKVFEMAWKRSQPALLNDFTWNETRYLVDLIKAAEGKPSAQGTP